jgi:hypothetical protein
MDKFANKKIKITRNALTGRNILTITDKEVIQSIKKGFLGNKKFYSTNCASSQSEKKDKYLGYITPIKSKTPTSILSISKQYEAIQFSAMDIETMDILGEEVPVSISIMTKNASKIFIIDPIKLKSDLNLAIKDLWNGFFTFILVNCNKNNIFVHNLGSFDGFFLYKGLSNKFAPDQISCLIDNHNKFIQITLQVDKVKVIFKDSYRIFPVSLNDLCEILGVKGKTSTYKPEYHQITLFNNLKLLSEFKEYSLQDSKALFNCMVKLQEMYLTFYNVDICSILSTSTLSLKIFRSKYLNVDIPVLKRRDDNFIRMSYFGGATDYYAMYAKDIHYYDVNSLYPFSMCKPMPFELIRNFSFSKGGYEFTGEAPYFNLNKFFGFLKVEVTCPKSIKVPVLPVKYNGKTIFPTGTWIATYFSEELKAVLEYGYKFKYLEGYEFSKIDLFSEYVHNFFEQKKNSSGPSRFIAKMHLNQLYGIFGRKHDLLETVNIYKEDLDLYISSRIIKSIIPINDKIVALLMLKNVNDDLITKLNYELKLNLSNYQYLVKANVAIASAVTSYSRIHMIPFKANGLVLYSDTDSIFTTEKLDDNFIGKELGLMKDELDGLIIKEAYFLGVKKYGYQYLDKNNNLITKSVFAGIQRDSLTFDEIVKLSNGSSLTKYIPLRFYKSLKNLNVVISSTSVSISRSLDKHLVNNKYIPLHLNGPLTINNSFFNYLKKKILNLIRSIIS